MGAGKGDLQRPVGDREAWERGYARIYGGDIGDDRLEGRDERTRRNPGSTPGTSMDDDPKQEE